MSERSEIITRAGPVECFLDTASPEALFVLSGVAQYLGATIAISVFDEVGPATVAWLRVLSAAVALLGVHAARRRHRRPWTRSEILAAAVFGIATAAMNLFFYLAIDRIPLGTGVAIEFIGPVAVAAARTRSRRNAASLALAATGVAVLGSLELGAEPLGLLFVGLASAMWAVYIVVGAHVARLDRGIGGLAVGLGVGAVALAPVGAPSSGPVWSSAGLLAACVAVGLLSSAASYGIDQHVLRRVPVRRFSVLLALLPITAVAVGVVALDQRPSPADLLGIALVITGVVLQEREVRTRADPQGAPARP